MIDINLTARWTVKLLHRYIGRHFSFAARVFEIADRLFEHDVFLGAEFFNQIGGLLEWHAAIVVATWRQATMRGPRLQPGVRRGASHDGEAANRAGVASEASTRRHGGNRRATKDVGRVERRTLLQSGPVTAPLPDLVLYGSMSLP